MILLSLGCDRWLYRVLHLSSLWARRHGSAHHDEVTSEGAFHIDWNDCDDGHEFRCRDNAFKRGHWYYSDLERVARYEANWRPFPINVSKSQTNVYQCPEQGANCLNDTGLYV